VPTDADRDDPFEVDAGLVRAAQRGDTLALDALIGRLLPYVTRICGPIALASGPDAAQDAIIAVLRALPGLREPRALRGWTRAIAVREAVRHATRDARAQPVDTSVFVDLPTRDDPLLRTDVHAVLARLSPQHRAVLVLRDLDGLDEEAAAQVLDVPVGTVKSRLHRARRMFRKEWTR
jgi:RNA polymerase sigma factor (sigma-70 family)